MSHRINKNWPAIVACCLAAQVWLQTTVAEDRIRFGKDILPILSANCYACHGPDEHDRKGDLRLDVENDALAEHSSGRPVVPGKPHESTIIQRIGSPDPDMIMPPPDSGKTLKPEQIELLRRWIEEGGQWGRHWSFEPIQRPALDQADSADPGAVGALHPVDHLVVRSLKQQGLSLSPTAAPETLIRRLSLDLIGLPPSPALVERFARNPSEQEYRAIVDELLASPEFGEHWARMWLDLARYADTKGYEKDLGRTMWPWRDWVINAFNKDMPLDQFTIEQLAGDLLPNPTQDQLIATAFHRNTMSNDEGGTDDEEFRIAAIKDRTDTTIQVWMGLTMGCAKCHTHKYDPISQQEYYQVYAVFNQTEDADRYDDAPVMQVISPEQKEQLRVMREEVQVAEEQLVEAEVSIASASQESPVWILPVTQSAASVGGAEFEVRKEGDLKVSGASTAEDTYTISLTLPAGTHRSLRLEAIPERISEGKFGVGRNPADPNFVVSELTVEQKAGDEWRSIVLAQPRADFSQDGWPVDASIDGDPKTGWAISPQQSLKHVAIYDFQEPIASEGRIEVRVQISQQYGNRLTLRRFRLMTSDRSPEELKPETESSALKQQREQLAARQMELKAFEAELANLPIYRELTGERRRTTKVHRRGNFLDPGDIVEPGLLTAFSATPPISPVNRLELAKWLMSSDNPLTARVWANRIWARIFGAGIVETEEDFGALGSAPSHPELLDWLAAEYRDSGWSLKALLRQIVITRTYRQASQLTASSAEFDPLNRLLSRGARYRLSAEVIRDQTLAVSGLLSLKKGGPPVMPPQPAGLWRSTYSGKNWIDAEGEDRVRRGIYTYLKRTTPYPSMTTFDGGSGEVCQIRRIRTNTPLQALVTLNDPVYLEAAAALATRMVEQAPTAEERALLGLRLALVRPVRPEEAQPLLTLQADAAAEFAESAEDTAKFLSITRARIPDGIEAAEFAGWIVSASAILNLDEFLTRN